MPRSSVSITAAACGLLLLAGTLGPPAAGAANAEVAAVQVAMRALGLRPGPVDGVTGPRTRRAVRTFQRRQDLAADGVAGPRTRRALGRRGRPALGRRAMRRGQRGFDVAALQFLLKVRGFDPGGNDGGFGAGTLRAVRAYQRAVGLARDDVAGPRTIRALRTRTVARGGRASGPVRFLAPVAVGRTDGFGRVGGRRHTGLDYPLAGGDPVHAAGRGVVVFAGRNDGGYGNLVVVRHRLGFETWYAHLSSFAVRAGSAVVGGSLIGGAGSTGRSTGPHLHFEVRRYGTPVDPEPWFVSRAAASGRDARVRTSATARSASGGATGRVARRLVCRVNADVRPTRDTDPPRARKNRCP
ncbi:MAG: peptidoglycan DD-metalloendopeptidase family protein [Solirubrobacteraceae bacterium]|nr:peptidoglycan DD-metalloendopeptidase family protein [Solirubrobacteraceae bacterium]